jgi:hypothetical protein
MVDPKNPRKIPPTDFELGRIWGHIESEIFEDTPRSDSLRAELLLTLVDYVALFPDNPISDIRAALAEAYSDYQCHGRLSRDSLCSECGATN